MFRSLLYVPANSERFIAKAHERGADAIILDLEDSVPLPEKAAARDNLAAAAASVARGGAKVFVRINSETILADAAAACRTQAYGLVVPKVKDTKTLIGLDLHLAAIERDLDRQTMPLIALIEDPGAVLDARLIARHHRVLGLALGGEDLATQLGARPTPEVLRFPKLLVHYAAKAEGRLSLGLLCSIADYSDIKALANAAAEARGFGFDGATSIHPSAVAILNEAFSPSSQEVSWAMRVQAAAEESEAEGIGAITLDGRMIDRPVVMRARRILEFTRKPSALGKRE